MFQKLRQFVLDVRAEFRKVNWPTREMTLKSTSIVLLLSTAVAIFLGAVDLGLSTAMRMMISI